jgi:DNA-binding HxlR family transcriptional regulator
MVFLTFLMLLSIPELLQLWNHPPSEDPTAYDAETPMTTPDTNLETPVCQHFQRAAELVGKRWTPQLIRMLLAGAVRYSDLKVGVPQISDHLLSERLKELEAEGIVDRQVTPSTPVRIEYRLTDRGRDLAGVIGELAAWAERWSTAVPASR